MSHNRLSYECVKYTIEKDNNFKLLSTEYVNNSEKLKLKCSCGNIFEISLNQFKNQNNKYCKKCNIERRASKDRHTIEYVRDVIENKFSKLVGINYRLISDKYVNIISKLEIEDDVGYKYYSNFKNITKNIKICCPLIRFSSRNKHTIYNIRNWIKINNVSINLISDEYDGNNKYLIWKCENGHIFKRMWNEVSQGCRCSKCNMSNAEVFTKEILDLNSILYKEQYTFDNLISPNSNRKLRFDFCIFENKSYKIKALIELDGQFHYKENNMIKNKQERIKAFNNQKLYDKTKNDYCHDKSIKLIRIPYWDFNKIKEILYNNNII